MSGAAGSGDPGRCRLAAIVSRRHRAHLHVVADREPVETDAAAQPAGSARVVLGGQVTARDAAFANGAFGNVLEMDDVHREAILHPGPVVVPAALALAAERDTGGPALLDAILRGYEAEIRVGRAMGHQPRDGTACPSRARTDGRVERHPSEDHDRGKRGRIARSTGGGRFAGALQRADGG